MRLPDTVKRLLSRPIPAWLTATARYSLAALFIFSGASKAIDTFGLSVKLGEYLSAFGLGGWQPLAPVGAILLPSVELLIGLLLLTRTTPRIAAWGVFLAMSFFTPLTLWIALTNPVSDCGCFGDLLRLSNWATFWKNLLFWPLSFVLFLNRNAVQLPKPSIVRTVVSYLILIPLSLMLSLWSYSSLPLLDPTPFRIGVHIPSAMSVQENDARTLLVYRDKTNGELREFEIADTTWYDSSRWEYVDTRTIGQSRAPEIQSLPMFDDRLDRSDEILGRRGYTLLFAVNAYDPACDSAMIALADYIGQYNGRSVALSAFPLPETLSRSGIECFGSDHTLLRTLIQHRTGGALLLHDGTIIGKWAMNRLPQWKNDGSDPLSETLTADRTGDERLSIVLFVAIVLLISLGFRLSKKTGPNPADFS